MRGIFETNEQYSAELNEEIRKYNQYDSTVKKNTNPSVKKAFLAVQLKAMTNISNRVNQAGNNSDDNNDGLFADSYHDLFESEKRRLTAIYETQIKSVAPSQNIEESLIQICNQPTQRRPAPAPETSPPRSVNPHTGVPESNKARNLRYFSYGLFSVSAVTGLTGSGFTAFGAKTLLSKTSEKAAKEAAKTMLVRGGICFAVSGATGIGGYMTHPGATESGQTVQPPSGM